MAIGVKVSSNTDIEKKEGAIKKKIESDIKKYIAKYGFDDEQWAEAISSQYFLLCLAEQLDWKKIDYQNLLNKCLSSFNVTYKGEYVLDKDKLLITPGETTHIVECMIEEDKNDNYFVKSAKLQAKNINSQIMYLNFHYGLLLRIVSSEDTEVLRAIKHICLDSLLSEQAIDSFGGWYPYRVPWITARILISLNAIDYSSYPKVTKLEKTIDDAIESLFQRINENAFYWRSGVGTWVSKWESTALCLEALYEWDAIDNKTNEVKKVLDYVCNESNIEEWILTNPGFETEETANNTLASVILSSVVARVSKHHYPDVYNKIHTNIFDYLSKVINIISKQDIKSVRQYCTIPQILHYVLTAIK